MQVKDLLENVSYEILSGDSSDSVTGISRNSKEAKAGDLFIATKGARFDSHDEKVLLELSEKGIRNVIVERPVTAPSSMNVFLVSDTRKAGAHIYATYYQNPADSLTLIGVTGSKGKTTTAHMITTILREAGYETGLIGTNGVSYGDTSYEIANTTPDYDELQKILRDMLDFGCRVVVLEVSSQAMKLYRCEGLTFRYGIWLNIQEGDHIGPNEHPDFDNYLQCKANVLKQSEECFAYGDDSHIEEFLQALGKPVTLFGKEKSYSISADSIRKGYDEESKSPYISFTTHGECEYNFRIPFPGDFNTWNALPAILTATRMGISPEVIQGALLKVRIKGRDEIIFRNDRFMVCVDFAHNGPSAFHHLEAMREYRPKRLIVVFGADGNRSKDRRYGMGEAAGKLADFSIITSGHNRNETFEAILEDTLVGLHRAENPSYIAIKDRIEAIHYAIDNAEEGDLITILGLGHEHWQEENGVKKKYNDEETVLSYLREKQYIE